MFLFAYFGQGPSILGFTQGPEGSFLKSNI